MKDNQIKDCKIFSPYTQFKNFNLKALSFKMLKKQKNIMLSQTIKIKILFVQYLFDFDARYRDQNFIFVFDHSTRTFLTSDIFIKPATIVSNEYLRYGKNFDINSFFTDWFVSKKKGNGEL